MDDARKVARPQCYANRGAAAALARVPCLAARELHSRRIGPAPGPAFGRACLALVLVILAGCASVRLQPPSLAVSRVTVDRLTPTDARFSVYVTVGNPNDRAIAVEAIEASLRIEDVVIGAAHLAEPVRLPPRGEATARLLAHADLPSSLRAAAQVAAKAQMLGNAFSGIGYAVEGRASVDGGNVYPFSRRGEIAWRP